MALLTPLVSLAGGAAGVVPTGKVVGPGPGGPPQRVDLISSPMVKRYWNDVADDDDLDWEFTEKVLSSHDIESHIVKDRVFAALNRRRI
jgi:hypothetical protein